eukprot:TRINITY_DN15353_c0_g2_i1.p1 TRINITY_DN15353_c0_g2~~TRINITY_DN15353_c0_g2_i1.p1  ORF type:complete len:322 (-),score=37.73 TRINITY_DN15353_c0_g2_i1:135-1100(-)
MSTTLLAIFTVLLINCLTRQNTLFAKAQDVPYGYEAAFEEFKKTYGKSYGEQEDTRKAIFKENYERIARINGEGNNFTLEINQFADLTLDEFQITYLSLSKSECTSLPDCNNSAPKAITDKKDKDWDAEGHMSKVRDQGNCDSAWAFASVAFAEALNTIDGVDHDIVELSEQQIIDCVRAEAASGCKGGEPLNALNYIKDKGIVSGEDYPYRARREECVVPNARAYKIWGIIEYFRAGNSSGIASDLMQHPVVAQVNAKAFEFMFYKSGILDKRCPSTEINHPILIVGKNETHRIPYWKIRNSWGPQWGENGHIRIKKRCG